MPQGEYIERHRKLHGRRLDHAEKQRKKKAREGKEIAADAKRFVGKRAKAFHKTRYQDKVKMNKKIKEHEEKMAKVPKKKNDPKNPLPTFLMDRANNDRAAILSNSLKQKRKEKAGKWAVPIPKVKPMAEDEMFKVMKTGKKKQKMWKRMITKATFVGENFTRKPPKLERFVRPMALRHTKAHVSHPELKATFQLPIVGVKHNPQSRVFTGLGVMTKGTIIEVNVSELGMVTPGGKVVWGKYAQVTNNPENDGCVNAVLLV